MLAQTLLKAANAIMLVVYTTLVSSTFRDILLILPDKSSFSSLPELASTSVTNEAILRGIFTRLGKKYVTAQRQHPTQDPPCGPIG